MKRIEDDFMTLDYRFPLFDELTQGGLNPLLERNHADTDFLQRLKEQIVSQAADAGMYQLSFIRWEHPKTIWYRQLIVGETFAYINELLETLKREDNLHIKSYLRDLILDKHLTVCLQKLGDLIHEEKLSLQRLTQPTTEDADTLCNCFVFQLLKVCLSKAYLEVQHALGDVVPGRQNETMLYAAYCHEIPPIRSFLKERRESNTKTAQTSKTSDKKSTPGTEQAPVAEFISVKDAAKRLNVDEKTVRRRLQSGVIKGKSDTGRWLIFREEFEHYVEELKRIKPKHE